jgi:DNA-binding MarR family transcriptional regulator
MCEMNGDPEFASGWDVFLQMRRTQHRFEVAMDQCLEAFGISYAQYRALELILQHQGAMQISTIARRQHLSRQAARSSVYKLQRCDYVEFERLPHEVYVRPTRAARAHIAKMRRFADVPQRIEERFGLRGCGNLVELLQRAEHAAQPVRQPPWWLAP